MQVSLRRESNVIAKEFWAMFLWFFSISRYDYFKSVLLQTKYFKDNIYCHFTASLFAGTVATSEFPRASVLFLTLSDVIILSSRLLSGGRPEGKVDFIRLSKPRSSNKLVICILSEPRNECIWAGIIGQSRFLKRVVYTPDPQLTHSLGTFSRLWRC